MQKRRTEAKTGAICPGSCGWVAIVLGVAAVVLANYYTKRLGRARALLGLAPTEHGRHPHCLAKRIAMLPYAIIA
jgi:hypothetical protein